MSVNSVPLNDLQRYFRMRGTDLVGRAEQVIRSGYCVLGPQVAAFESSFAEYCNVRHCIGVANGTDAIEIALRCVGVQQGQQVVVAANAGMYATTAVLAIGASPLFADIDESYSLTAESIETALSATVTRPAAIVVTHLYGRLASIHGIARIADAWGIPLIEDCAQAHGAQDAEGRFSGSFGAAAAFSFYPTKNLGALGDGGAVVTDHDGIQAQARMLRQYGWRSKYVNALPGGRNSRLDEIQAAFLSTLLVDLDRRNTRRREIANHYSASIRHAAIQVPAVSGNDYVAHLYVVRSAQRDALAAHMAASRIATDVHYPVPDHCQPVLASAYAEVELPQTEAACREVLTLPCFPEMDDQEVDAVVAACNAWPA